MKKIICPACQTPLDEIVSVCPNCGLSELSRIFFNKAKRDEWVTEILNPFIETIMPKIFVSKGNALFLTSSGALYGVGENDKNQLSDSDEIWIDTPLLIANDVISADVGLDYVIWADKEGYVHLRGSGEYIDSFSGFKGAKKVLLDPQENIFWIIDLHGSVYVFGNNFNGSILPLMEEIIPIEGDFHADITFEKDGIHSHGSSGTIYYTNNEDDAYRALKADIMALPQCTGLLKKHGKANFSIELELINKILLEGNSLSANEHKERRLFKVKGIVKNIQLVTPVKMFFGEDKIPIPLKKIPRSSYEEDSTARELERLYNIQENICEKDGDKLCAMYMQEFGNIVLFVTQTRKIFLIHWKKTDSLASVDGKNFSLYYIRNGAPHLESAQ